MSWRGRTAAKSSSRASVQSFSATSQSIRNRFHRSEILVSMYLAAEISAPPATPPATEVALREFDHVYSFIYARVGNRADAAWVERTLSALPSNYRRVLELRFLRGYTLHETADEMGKTVGGIKVMQLRALRAAARVGNAG